MPILRVDLESERLFEEESLVAAVMDRRVWFSCCLQDPFVAGQVGHVCVAALCW
jgi:hypothetical protein